MVLYGRSRAVAPVFLNRSLTRNEVNAQILKSNGVLAVWVSDDNKRHAVDIIGLIRQPAWGGGENRGYVVWNPWYNYTELCDANNENNVLYYTPGRTWTWRETITNW